MADFKQKLLNGIVWRLVNVISSFVFNLALVNRFGAADSGNFFFQLNNLSFAALVLGFGIESGISYYNTRREISANSLFTIGILWSLAAALVFAWIFYATQIFTGYPGAEKTLFIPAYLLGSLLTTLLGSLFYSNHDNRTPNLLSAGANILLTITLLIAPTAGAAANARFIDLYFLVYAILGLLTVGILVKRKMTIGRLRTEKIGISALMRYSLFSFFLASFYTLLKRSDYWLVEKFCSPADMGNYFQSTRIIQLVLLLPSLASFSLYPLLVESVHQQAETGKKDTETRVIRLSAFYMILSAIIGLFLLLAGSWLFPFLYGHTFGKMYPIVLLLTPGLVMFAGTYPLSAYFSGLNKNSINIRGLAISILIMVTADLLLLPHYSIFGAAAGSSLANSFYFVYLLLLFKRQNNLTLEDITKNIRPQKEFFALLKSAGRWIS